MIVKQSNQLYLSLGGKSSHPSISPQPNVANLLAFRFYTVAIRLFALRVPCEAKALPLHKRTLRVALARACIRVECRVRSGLGVHAAVNGWPDLREALAEGKLIQRPARSKPL